METSGFSWQPYGGGYLARSSKGYYLVYQRFFDLEGGSRLWLAKFEESGIQKHPSTTLDLQRFANVEDAKVACEEHANRFASPPRHGPSIEGVSVPTVATRNVTIEILNQGEGVTST